MRIITDLQTYLSAYPDGDKVYNFLKSIDSDTPKGRRVFNDTIYVNVISCETTKDFDGVMERHRKYIDLQVLISGDERIYYCEKGDYEVVKEYDEDNDYEFIRASKSSYVDYTKMQGVELLTGEPHMGNRCAKAPQKILKVVVKIKA